MNSNVFKTFIFSNNSPYSTPKTSNIIQDDVVAVIRPPSQESSRSKASKAISESSLNNVLDWSGRAVRNITSHRSLTTADLSSASDTVSQSVSILCPATYIFIT